MRGHRASAANRIGRDAILNSTSRNLDAAAPGIADRANDTISQCTRPSTQVLDRFERVVFLPLVVNSSRHPQQNGWRSQPFLPHLNFNRTDAQMAQEENNTHRILNAIAVSVALGKRPTASPYAAMGTVISPRHVVVPISTMPKLPDSVTMLEETISFNVHFQGIPGMSVIPARIERVDLKLELAVLELAKEVEIPDIKWLQEPLRGGVWTSLIVAVGIPDGMFIHGIVEEVMPTEEGTQLHLALSVDIPDLRNVVGAPVVIDDMFSGIITGADSESHHLIAHTIPGLSQLLHSGSDPDSWFDESLSEMNSEAPLESTSTSETSSTTVADPPPNAAPTPDPIASSTTDVATETKAPPITLESILDRLGRKMAYRVIERAVLLHHGLRESALHMEHLIGGFLEQPGNPLSRVLAVKRIADDALDTVLMEAAGVTEWMGTELSIKPEDLAPVPPLTYHASRAIAAAVARADRDRSREIKARHLLLGALEVVECSVIKGMADLGITLAEAERILAPIDPGNPSRAGFSTDAAAESDLLGVTREVDALAQVIASRDVEPPLSIGLFGDWGSGKSTFMKLMEDSIRTRMTDESRRADGKRIYCKNIVQIWFNAWHYIDTNLWASLTSEIFKELSCKLEKENDRNPALARERLLAAARGASDILAEAERRKCAAESDLRASTERVQKLMEREEEIEIGLKQIAREAYRVVAEEPEVKVEIERAAKALNIPTAQRAATDVKAQLMELGEAGGAIKALRLALSNAGTRKIFLRLAGAIAGAALIALITLQLWPDALDATGRLISWASGMIGGGLLFIAPFMKVAKRALGFIRRVSQSSQEMIEKAKEERRTELEAEKKKVAAKLSDAEAHVKDARAQLESYERKLEELRADRKMADFIRERNESGDYTKHLGVIAAARNDFERLSDLLEEVRTQKEKPTSAGEALLPHIDRIILYIDDLDRCPEERVVEVLQAVHLLLAFKLFVVVVGVDSRWLLHSLKRHMKAFGTAEGIEAGEAIPDEREWQSTPLNYLEKIFQIPFTLRPMQPAGFGDLIDALAGAGDGAARAGGNGAANGTMKSDEVKGEEAALAASGAEGDVSRDDGGSPERNEESEGGSAPREEQPTTDATAGLREKGSQDTETRVAGNGANGNGADRSTARSSSDATAVTTGATDSGNAASTNGDAAQSGGAEQTNGSQQIADAMQTEITEHERAVMKALYPLIPSPRATKRFVNIYRLLRALVFSDGRAAFIGDANGGGHRVVLLLLAVMTGYPDEASEILRALVERRPDGPWWEFIDSFADWKTIGHEVADDEGVPIRTVRRDEAERWEELLEKLGEMRELIDEEEGCDPFIAWAPEVARYSFQSGKLLFVATEASGEE